MALTRREAEAKNRCAHEHAHGGKRDHGHPGIVVAPNSLAWPVDRRPDRVDSCSESQIQPASDAGGRLSAMPRHASAPSYIEDATAHGSENRRRLFPSWELMLPAGSVRQTLDRRLRGCHWLSFAAPMDGTGRRRTHANASGPPQTVLKTAGAPSVDVH